MPTLLAVLTFVSAYATDDAKQPVVAAEQPVIELSRDWFAAFGAKEDPTTNDESVLQPIRAHRGLPAERRALRQFVAQVSNGLGNAKLAQIHDAALPHVLADIGPRAASAEMVHACERLSKNDPSDVTSADCNLVRQAFVETGLGTVRAADEPKETTQPKTPFLAS